MADALYRQRRNAGTRLRVSVVCVIATPACSTAGAPPTPPVSHASLFLKCRRRRLPTTVFLVLVAIPPPLVLGRFMLLEPHVHFNCKQTNRTHALTTWSTSRP